MENLKILPEYFFAAGPTMQDIPREEFAILNGCDAASHSIDKDMYPTFIYKIQNTSPSSPLSGHLPKDGNNENGNEVASIVPVKLEDINTIELFPCNSSSWQQYQSQDLSDPRSFLDSHHTGDRNCAKLLLQGSDDPLISHGANNVLCHDDEHPADFARSLITPTNTHFIQDTCNKEQQQPQEAESQREISKFSNAPENNQRLVKSGCSNLTRQQLKVKANLMSARNQQHQQNQIPARPLNTAASSSMTHPKTQRTQKPKNKKPATVKLRFHHQALPPEYLSHYEATQAQQNAGKNPPAIIKATNQRNPSKSATGSGYQKQSQPRNSHENVRSWLQKIAEIQRTANASKEREGHHLQKSLEKEQCMTSTGSSKLSDIRDTSLKRLAAIDVNNNNSNSNSSSSNNNNHKAHKRLDVANATSSTPAASNSAILNDKFLTNSCNNNNFATAKHTPHYSDDLPFMGEITLDNCKPRRGRKPKKADICHLIYKNYGTILPKKTKANQSLSHLQSDVADKSPCCKSETYEQPLNLCLRDQINDSYSISSGDELSETTSSCPTPVGSTFDYVRDSMLAHNFRKSLKSINEHDEGEKQLNTTDSMLQHTSKEGPVQPLNVAGYNKLLTSINEHLDNANDVRYKTTRNKDKQQQQPGMKIPLQNDFFRSPATDKTLASPNDLNLDNMEPRTASSNHIENAPLNTAIATAASPQLIAPQKRKRSAIFIPPMNIENTNNPVTEVSICKFKFTGGSKPTLQEKKMISVDAGGNYRYFSGTGDKASRGYEYFPRESLQHTAGLLPGVNCIGHKLHLDTANTSTTLVNDLLLSNSQSAVCTDQPIASRSFNLNSDSVSSASPTNSTAEVLHLEVSKNEACSLTIRKNSSFSSSRPATSTATPPTTSTTTNRRAEEPKNYSMMNHVKKLSKKEKLRKIFQEQGFLIQTQQLECAEGATYCKFRQLKKFTRYLFRNWKDYLPKNTDVKQSTIN